MKPDISPVEWFLGINPKYWPWLAAIVASLAVIVVMFKIEAFLKATKAVGGLFSLFKKEVTPATPTTELAPPLITAVGLRVIEGSFFKLFEQHLTLADTVRPSPSQEEALLRLFTIHLHVLAKRPTLQKRLTLDMSLIDKHNSSLVRIIITLIETTIEKYPDIELQILLAKEPMASLASAADVWKGQIKAIEVKKGEGYVSIVTIVHKQ